MFKPAYQLKRGDVLHASGQTVLEVFDSVKCPKDKINVMTVLSNGRRRLSVWNKSTKIRVRDV